MAYVPVPKDLTKVKTKVAFNLTKRQLICFSLAALCGIPIYFLTKKNIGTDMAATIMIIVMLPFFFMAMYEKDGFPAEKILFHIIRQKFIRPGVRVFRTENMYERLIQESEIEKEGARLVNKETKAKEERNPFYFLNSKKKTNNKVYKRRKTKTK